MGGRGKGGGEQGEKRGGGENKGGRLEEPGPNESWKHQS